MSINDDGDDEDVQVAEDDRLSDIEHLMDGNAPDEIIMDEIPFDLAFHPSSEIVVVGTVTGNAECYRYSEETEGNEHLYSVTPHKKAVRAVRFSDDGSTLFTSSSDKSLGVMDVETGSELRKVKKAHDSAIYSMSVHEHFVVTGDDDGIIKVWDMRQESLAPTHEYEEHEDYVAQILFVPASRKMISVGGDGYVAVLDFIYGGLIARSDQMESELSCVALIKAGSKCVVGTQEGVFEIWRTGDWGNISNRVTSLHSASVESMLAVDDDRLITSSEDGKIRLMSVEPTRLHDVIGDHGTSSVDRIAFTHDRKYLGSVGQDGMVKFHDIAPLFANKAKRKQQPRTQSRGNGNLPAKKFFAGLTDD